uniref:Uncharacterized protein n=1 Tax=Cucumis melo TaxID=3656 RepID=A0A9I9E7Y4_CUCME
MKRRRNEADENEMQTWLILIRSNPNQIGSVRFGSIRLPPTI